MDLTRHVGVAVVVMDDLLVFHELSAYDVDHEKNADPNGIDEVPVKREHFEFL